MAMDDRENLAGSAYIGDSREVKSTHTRTESFSHEETGNQAIGATKAPRVDISSFQQGIQIGQASHPSTPGDIAHGASYPYSSNGTDRI